ncbi:hypothetical protein NQ176_g750 [Zarea fungicola]|uniref:Uncharacterized protein n=1 Tax=Zarea fungicola TaxID=93591 RepID=A0ACC1NVK7_9HYPO|nr:hypothetical protein NQ176_g750 [Lecanicillium fungicola]
MKISPLTVASIVAAGALASPTDASRNKALLGKPNLEFLYTANITIGERWSAGDTGKGTRVIIPLEGGTFHGPRLSGTVNAFGGDWGVMSTKGIFYPDVRYNLKTHDGVDIYIQTSGAVQPDTRALLRGIYETGDPKYEWLNSIVATGVMKQSEHYVLIDMWQMKLPQQ